MGVLQTRGCRSRAPSARQPRGPLLWFAALCCHLVSEGRKVPHPGAWREAWDAHAASASSHPGGQQMMAQTLGSSATYLGD